jgi:hypothetical protein
MFYVRRTCTPHAKLLLLFLQPPWALSLGAGAVSNKELRDAKQV